MMADSAGLQRNGTTADARLVAALKACATEFPGRVGYRFANATTGAVIEHRADEIFPTASAVKLPLLTAFHLFVQRGGCTWDDEVTVDDASIATGSGILGDLDLPRTLSCRDAAWLMICLSDNTATNLLLRRMGLETTNALIAEFAGDAIAIDKPAGPPPGAPSTSMGHATPGALGRYLDALAGHTVPGATETIAVARRQLACGGIPRYLPFERDDQARLAIAHKNGSLAGVATDIGILSTPATPGTPAPPGAPATTVTMAVMVAEAADTSDVFENEPEKLIGRLALLAHDAWLGTGDGVATRQNGV